MGRVVLVRGGMEKRGGGEERRTRGLRNQSQFYCGGCDGLQQNAWQVDSGSVQNSRASWIESLHCVTLVLVILHRGDVCHGFGLQVSCVANIPHYVMVQ